MISTPQQFSVLIDELSTSTWTLAAIGVLFDSGLADQLRQSSSLDELCERCSALSRERIERCLAVAVVRGVVVADGGRYQLAPGVLPSLEPGERLLLQGDYRSNLLQPAEYLRSGRGRSAWSHADPMVLQAQGDGSSRFASGVKYKFAPELGDLAERLARPGARFLDVGAGVGALSIAMCQHFPALSVVGIDASETPLALARENIARARLADRIELRRTDIDDLRDQAAFDLAWLPAFFLGSHEAVERAIERIKTALRPGGWLLVAAMNPATGEAQRAIWSLVLESWGGPVQRSDEVEALFAKAGLASRTFAGPSWISLVAGQRS